MGIINPGIMGNIIIIIQLVIMVNEALPGDPTLIPNSGSFSIVPFPVYSVFPDLFWLCSLRALCLSH